MMFYKASALIVGESWVMNSIDPQEKRIHIRDIRYNTNDWNESQHKEHFCFVSHIGDPEISCGIISFSPENPEKYLSSFFLAIGFSVKEIEVHEITLSAISKLLSHAYHTDFIENDDEVMEEYGLDRIRSRFKIKADFDEFLLKENKDPHTLYEKAHSLVASDTLLPELDRIYSGKQNKEVYGHPVHYVIETDNREVENDLTELLLQALYDNGRLQSRRYSSIEVKVDPSYSAKDYEAFYKSSAGGAVLVRYIAKNTSDDAEQYASSEIEDISMMCENLIRYRNQVLTVFSLPRECERIKRQIYEEIGSVAMIELRENLADCNTSREYLKQLCKKAHMIADPSLYCALESNKTYLPEELRTLFDQWFNEKMRTSVFPQYKEITVCRSEMVKETVKGNAYEELENMIGLKDAKDVIHKALNYYKLQRVYKDKGISQNKAAMHMVFTGNPGTAKTTVARLFARIMKDNGVLSTGKLVEVGRGDLVGKYVGWTAHTVKEKFRAAMGGVLFIDEAYSLLDDRSGSYGDEAINTIVQEMENRREDLVVIFAGYPEEMERFLQRNPGLRSRIAFHVPFSDYSVQELCEIAEVIGKREGISLSNHALKKLSGVFENARQQKDFGNGRYVRNILELSRMNLANRILDLDPDSVTEKQLTQLEEVDIEIPKVQTQIAKREIGFSI